MRILFIHQNFPGQYIHILRALAQENCHTLVGLGIRPLKNNLPKSIIYRRYSPSRGNTDNIHPLILETETKVIRGEACAEAAHQLKREGFEPEIICAHPGWGESLFIKTVWPSTPILSYQEFWYQSRGYDYAFDPEFLSQADWHDEAKIRMKNCTLQLSLEGSSWNITPTLFQRKSFPKIWQKYIEPLHDGIDTDQAAPNPEAGELRLKDGVKLLPGEPTVTYINRALEPYRGCHTMVRAIPYLQRLFPSVRIIIVGSSQRGAYGKVPKEGTWIEKFLEEIDGNYDQSRVHFTGSLKRSDYLHLLKLSAVHIYLTYPFVLSWSMLEAMSSGCAVVGSNTTPVQEVIEDNYNGLLVDFFQPEELAIKTNYLLRDRNLSKRLGKAARNTILERYSLKTCVPKQIKLIKKLGGY